MKEQIRLYEPIYAKRSAIIADLPKFWPRVIEQVGYDIDRHITEIDARLLDSLLDFKVSRHDPTEPRNFTITLTFESNEYLQDTAITKVFSLKSAKDPTLQSTKSSIAWKPNNDLTAIQPGGAKSFFHFFDWTGEERKKEMTEYEELAITLVEDIWPNAIKYYTESFEEESEEDENAEIDLEADDDDDDEELEEEEEEDENQPPSKKRKNGV